MQDSSQPGVVGFEVVSVHFQGFPIFFIWLQYSNYSAVHHSASEDRSISGLPARRITVVSGGAGGSRFAADDVILGSSMCVRM